MVGKRQGVVVVLVWGVWTTGPALVSLVSALARSP